MNFKSKLMLILILCLVSCIGAYFIITKMYDNLENQFFEKCRIESKTGARIMSEMMEFMVKNNILKEAELFDTNYKEIKGTNPKKFYTMYDAVFDKYIQNIEDVFLKDPDIDFAVLIDKNGYISTHNRKYSKNETKDYKTDLINSRSKRIYISFPAIKKALGYRGNDTIKTLYHRDTGEIMWNIGAPVKFREKHWGTFLIGVSLERINALKQSMSIMIIVVMFIILGLTLLAIIAIIPKKLLAKEMDIKSGEGIL